MRKYKIKENKVGRHHKQIHLPKKIQIQQVGIRREHKKMFFFINQNYPLPYFIYPLEYYFIKMKIYLLFIFSFMPLKKKIPLKLNNYNLMKLSYFVNLYFPS